MPISLLYRVGRRLINFPFLRLRKNTKFIEDGEKIGYDYLRRMEDIEIKIM